MPMQSTGPRCKCILVAALPMRYHAPTLLFVAVADRGHPRVRDAIDLKNNCDAWPRTPPEIARSRGSGPVGA